MVGTGGLGERVGGLLNPSTVAVVGAKDDLTTAGGRFSKSIMESSGISFIAVNPSRDTVFGAKCYPSLSEIPTDVVVDQVVCVVSADKVLGTLQAAIGKGVGTAVVVSGGFGESHSTTGKCRGRALEQFAADNSLAILGPNCYGYANVVADKHVTGAAYRMTGGFNTGSVGVVSQSGGLGLAVVPHYVQAMGAGLSHLVSVGNQLNVDSADVVDYLSRDPNTQVILLVLEGTSRGRPLLDAVRQATSSGKDVFYLKLGRTGVGRASVASHTAAFAGDDNLYESLLRESGAVRADTPRELAELAALAERLPHGRGAATGILSASGGAAALAADLMAAEGVDLPEPTEETQRRLGEVLPDYASTKNPIDLTVQAIRGDRSFIEVVEVLDKSAEFDNIVLVLTYAADFESMLRSLDQIDLESTLVILWMGSDAKGAAQHYLVESSRLAWSDSPKAMAALLRARPHSRQGSDLRSAAEHRARQIDQPVVQSWFREQGLNLPDSWFVAPDELADDNKRLAGISDIDPDDARTFYVKGLAADVAHREAAGHVRGGVDAKDIESAVRHMFGRSGVAGVQIQENVSHSIEVYVGALHDPTFGLVFLIGSGGRGLEESRDVSVALPGWSDVRYRRSLEIVSAGRKWIDLAGSHQAVGDLRRVLTAIERNQAAFQTVDVNPLVVAGDGTSCLVDVKATAASSHDQHHTHERGGDR